jgi:hypothetical protein
MPSIKFDNTEILNTTYIPRYVKHESAPERALEIMELAREDGAILISERYGTKTITLAGILTATTQALLEQAIDNFKLLFSGKEKNLDIDFAGGTRRYVATCQNHIFDRDHFHLLFVPWSAEFIVMKGIGQDTTPTTAMSPGLITPLTTQADVPCTFYGSAKPKPTMTFTFFGTWSGLDTRGVEFKNTDTGERIVFTNYAGFAHNDILIFNFDTKKVTLNGVEKTFYGMFPTLNLGAINYSIQFADIPDESFEGSYDVQPNIAGNNWRAQSFMVPYTDKTYKGVSLYLKKLGTPAADLTVRIETDNNGEPSGTCVKDDSSNDVEMTIAKGDVSTSYAWLKTHAGDLFTLNPNTRYWIVAKSTGSSVGNHFIWPCGEGVNATYKRGNQAESTDGGSTWTDNPTLDCKFRILFGGEMDLPNIDQVNLVVSYYKNYI